MRLFGANNFFLPSASWRRSFFVTLFFVTLAAFLFWLDSFRLYESEIRVLLIDKTANAATDQVAENFAELVGNLSFYDRVLAANDLIDDDFAGYAPDKRKALWNEMVSARRSDGSGVLVITARQDTSEKARFLNEETVKTLFSVAGFYYDIRTDVDLRVVDGAIVKMTVRSPFWYVLTSLGSAFVLSVLFFWLLSVTPFFFEGRHRVAAGRTTGSGTGNATPDTTHQDYALGSAVPFIDPRTFVPARPRALSFESSHEEQRIRDEILSSVKAASAPADLPVLASSEKILPGMDATTLPFEFEETFREETSPVMEAPEAKAVFEAEQPPVKTGEPTIEEYKRRLNELLSGVK